MSSLILRPWPYEKNEEVELYWLCSPYMNIHRQWILKAVFKYYSDVKTVELPWGTLPYLRLGQKYRNGIAIDSYKRGSLGEIKINDENFEICNSFDMPPKLFYLYKNYEYGMQKMCKFTAQGIKYYIPCIEVLRSFFAKSKTLTNYILKPNGLDFLITESEITNDCLNISLSIEIPESIVNNETAAHLGWIKYNEEAFKSWTSVYGNIFDNGNVNHSYIQLLPPVRQDCKWNYRGINNDNSVLILELISSTGLRTPFKYIRFFHPKILRNKVTEIPEKIRRSKTEEGKQFELIDGKNTAGTRKQQNQPTLELPSTQFTFEDILKIEKIKEKNKEIFIGLKIIPNANIGSSNKKENDLKVSTGDWISEGKIEPIEFESLETVKGRKGKGLEEFYEVIKYIADNYNQFKISMTEIFLPESKSFSYYPDGSRRPCAIVKIDFNDKQYCYILEVGRADGWSISRLFLWPISLNLKQEIFERIIFIILEDLENNNGHWKNDSLWNNQQVKSFLMKHIKQDTYLKDALKIVNKCISLFNI